MRFSAVKALGFAPLLALCLTVRPAAAADVPISEEARQHFQAGVSYMQDPDGARYAEAYQEFLTAYAASPSWKILGNLGIAAMKLERDGEAVEAYTKYLQEAGADLDPSEREQITRDMNTLKTSLVNLTVEATPAGATIIDERIPATGNAIVNRYGPVNGPTKIGIKAGKHRLTAQLDGYDPLVWEINAQPGGDQPHTFELKKTPPPPPPGSFSANGQPVDRPTSGLRIASYAALGVGVVGLGAGTFFALRSKSKQNELKDLCGGNAGQCNIWDGDTAQVNKARSLNNDSGSAKTMAFVGFGVGAAGVAAGVVLFIVSGNKSSSASSTSSSHVASADKPRVVPYFGLDSAGVVGQF